MGELERLLKEVSGNTADAERLAQVVRDGGEDILERLRKALAAEEERQQGEAADNESECSWSEEARRKIWELKTIANERPLDVKPALAEAYRLTDLYGACYHAQVIATEAQVYRALRRFAEAEALLAKATDLTDCPLAHLDLARRRGILLAKSGRCEEALAVLTQTLNGYEALDGPGHDPNANGIASCLSARAGRYFELGRFEEAATDCRRCLTLYDPIEQEDLYVYTLVNLARTLYKGGISCPTEELSEAREYFARRKASIPRACLYWLAGQVHLRYGSTRRRARAQRYLRMARDDFLELRMYFEAGAVVSDLALTFLMRRDRLKVFLKRTLKLPKIKPADPSIVAAIGEVLKKSRSPESARYYADLEVAIEHLRSLAAGCEYTLPRLLTSPNAP